MSTSPGQRVVPSVHKTPPFGSSQVIDLLGRDFPVGLSWNHLICEPAEEICGSAEGLAWQIFNEATVPYQAGEAAFGLRIAFNSSRLICLKDSNWAAAPTANFVAISLSLTLSRDNIARWHTILRNSWTSEDSNLFFAEPSTQTHSSYR